LDNVEKEKKVNDGAHSSISKDIANHSCDLMKMILH